MIQTTDTSDAPKRSWWRRIITSSLGSIVLSWDFFLGVPIGVAIAFPASISDKVADSMSGALLGVCGIAAGLASLVLTAMTVLIGVIGPAYRMLLDRVTGGIDGVLRPYLIVVVLAILASLSALAAGLAWPLVTGLYWWLVWIIAAAPLALLSWSLLGCVQTVRQVVTHVKNDRTAEQMYAEVQARRPHSNAG